MRFLTRDALTSNSSPIPPPEGEMTGRRVVLGLYKRILTLHRRKLDPRMRVLGDSYVRDEFKRHKDAAAKFVPLFMQEWEQYAAVLAKKQDRFGRELLESEKSLFSSEQKEKLQSLREAAKSVGESMT